MNVSLRKFMLTIHIASSVGWLGAIACFLSIAAASAARHDFAVMGGAYSAMNWIGWNVLVPLSFASLLSGLIQSFGTEWGLLRHYWIIFKFAINLLANGVLLMFMVELRAMAALPASDGHNMMSVAPLLHSSVGLVLVMAATILSVYKPRGLTPYGFKQQQARALQRP